MADKINDGGPAFPQLAVVAGDRDGHGDAIDAYTTTTGGMSLRDYFAGRIMAAFIGSGDHVAIMESRTVSPKEALGVLAHNSFIAADAMLKARGQS